MVNTHVDDLLGASLENLRAPIRQGLEDVYGPLKEQDSDFAHVGVAVSESLQGRALPGALREAASVLRGLEGAQEGFLSEVVGVREDELPFVGERRSLGCEDSGRPHWGGPRDAELSW